MSSARREPVRHACASRSHRVTVICVRACACARVRHSVSVAVSESLCTRSVESFSPSCHPPSGSLALSFPRSLDPALTRSLPRSLLPATKHRHESLCQPASLSPSLSHSPLSLCLSLSLSVSLSLALSLYLSLSLSLSLSACLSERAEPEFFSFSLLSESESATEYDQSQMLLSMTSHKCY